ncbi:MAG TPA: potassium channel protein [Desulfobacteraceae bacterium]|nr:potassium channel protein [Desulfobacteraceae bacterium]
MGLTKRIYLSALSVCLVILAGTLGYYIIVPKVGIMDCLYMTVISLTTVGYGEVVPVSGNRIAEVFTICLICSGMGVILYAISMLTAAIIEGELSGAIRKKRMLEKIKGLSEHYIVCGGGKTGRPVLAELVKNQKKIVLIEADEEQIALCKTLVDDLLYLVADATDDDILMSAGIERAAGIIITLPSDKDNLYITMTSRMMNHGIRIISRMTNQKLKPKLMKAGANGVVSPNLIGALRLASEMIRPTVVDFLDSMLRSNQGNLRINQLSVNENSLFMGKAIADLELRKRFSLLLMGIKERGCDVEFDPSHDKVLNQPTELIVMGRTDDVENAVNWLKKQARA